MKKQIKKDKSTNKIYVTYVVDGYPSGPITHTHHARVIELKNEFTWTEKKLKMLKKKLTGGDILRTNNIQISDIKILEK